MKIGLIDADLSWRRHAGGRGYGKTKATIYPNIAIMKLAAYHKQAGDCVEWWQPMMGQYDIVYVSKVFSDTPDMRCTIVNADRVIYGGSGWCIRLEDGKEVWREPDDEFYSPTLPDMVEHIMPDYSIYPTVDNAAYGFMSRGCPRGCHFCHVKAKEGTLSYKVADLSEWWGGAKAYSTHGPKLACMP